MSSGHSWGETEAGSRQILQNQEQKHSPKEQSRHHTHVDLMSATYLTYRASCLNYDPYNIIDKDTTSFRWQ